MPGLIKHLLEKLLNERLWSLTANAVGSRPNERQVRSPGQHEASRAGGGISGSLELLDESPSDRSNMLVQLYDGDWAASAKFASRVAGQLDTPGRVRPMATRVHQSG